MADKRVYQDWQDKAARARELASDRSLPLWKKAYMIPGAYSGLELDGLQSKHRRKILNTLGQINVILKQYELETFENYQNIDEANIREIIRLAKGLSPAP